MKKLKGFHSSSYCPVLHYIHWCIGYIPGDHLKCIFWFSLLFLKLLGVSCHILPVFSHTLCLLSLEKWLAHNSRHLNICWMNEWGWMTGLYALTSGPTLTVETFLWAMTFRSFINTITFLEINEYYVKKLMFHMPVIWKQFFWIMLKGYSIKDYLAPKAICEWQRLS